MSDEIRRDYWTVMVAMWAGFAVVVLAVELGRRFLCL